MRKHVFLGTLVSLSAQAQMNSVYYPEEFSDFFYMTRQQVTVSIAGERDAVMVPAKVNYDTFQLASGSEGAQIFSHYLDEKGLTASSINTALHAAEQGIITDSACSGRLSECVLSVEAGSLRYVFDFDRATLTVFVPPQYLRVVSEVAEYETALNSSNALINWSRLYVSSDVRGDESLTWSNESLLGLPVGALVFDTQYSSSSDDFEVYKALYDANVGSHRLQAGRSRYALSFNTTDYLNSGATLAIDGAFMGSSTNLLKGKSADLQRLYFYAPQNGQLEIYRDDRLILNRIVNEGRQHVSYTDLPQGVYDIQIHLKVAGEVVLSETRLIVNNQNFSLPVGDWDYLIGGGRFLDNHGNGEVGYDDDGYENYIGYGEAPLFVRGMVNYRWTENLMVGVGVTANTDEQQVQLGGSYFFNDLLGLNYTAGKFTLGSRYQYVRVNAGLLYMDFRDFHRDAPSYGGDLATYLYGTRSFHDIGVGISGDLWGQANGYLSYQYYKQKDEPSFYEKDGDDTRHYVSGGLSTPLLGGDLSFSSSYTIESNRDDEARVDMTWTWRLGEHWSTQMRLTADEEGFNQNTNYLRAEKRWENWAANASLGATVTREYSDGYDVGTDISGTVNGHANYVNADAYAYTNAHGERRFSGGLSGTQIVSTSGVDLTYEKAPSFAKITRHTVTQEGLETSALWPVQYNITRDGDYQYRGYLAQDNNTTLIKAYEYSELGLNVDDGGQNVAIKGDRLQTFVHPGSLYQLNTTVTPLKSRVVVLDDIFDEPVSQVQCVGAGCVSVEPLSDDGVFRVNYQYGVPFQLVSRKGLCITETLSNVNYDRGVCMPGLDVSRQAASWKDTAPLLDNAAHNPVLIYLGQFDDSSKLTLVTNKLTELGLTYQSVRLGGITYLYLVRNVIFNTQQRQFLEELNAYVLLQDSALDLLSFTSTWSENYEIL